MKANQSNNPESDFPAGIGRPARGALLAAGYTHLAQLAEVREAEITKLHGVGPKAIGVLRRALDEKGMSFAEKI
jgi:hypothetical protein